MSNKLQKDSGTRSTDNLSWTVVPKKLIARLITKTGYKITRINRETETSLVSQHIPGWFSVLEAEALYLLVATSSAIRILEIGHFLGRSTSAICEAIRDSGRTVEFNSYDLGFTNAEEFIAHYSSVHDTTSTSVPPEYDQLVFSKHMTTTEIAKNHLGRFALDRFVNLISGDFTILDKTRYGFIFCDAFHDLGEIAVNLPHVIAASNDDCVWAFHDMNPQNVGAILEHGGVRLIKVIDTLGIFRFSRAT
jgi:hypothetical protein